MLRRLEGWEQRLGEVFRLARGKQLQWGTFDCFLFPADAILALTNFDLAASFRGTYSTELEALRVLREMTGSETRLADAASVLSSRYALQIGAAAIHSTRARRGDIATVIGTYHEETFAVVDTSARQLATVSPNGLTFLPISSGLRFWAVG